MKKHVFEQGHPEMARFLLFWHKSAIGRNGRQSRMTGGRGRAQQAFNHGNPPDSKRRTRQVNAMTMIPFAEVVRRTRPPVRRSELPDFFGLIDQQARVVVSLAKAAGEVLQGKESARSVRLFDLEQRRQELRRRNQAAVESLFGFAAGAEEIQWTMDSLDQAAARLFRTAADFSQWPSGVDDAVREMMAIILRASESLQQGYIGLASGWPLGEIDVGQAMGSRDMLGSHRAMALRELLQTGSAPVLPPEQGFPAPLPPAANDRERWLHELYASLDNIAQHLASAAGILRRWSLRLSAGLNDLEAGLFGASSLLCHKLVTV